LIHFNHGLYPNSFFLSEISGVTACLAHFQLSHLIENMALYRDVQLEFSTEEYK